MPHIAIFCRFRRLQSMRLADNIDLQSGLIGGVILGVTSTTLMYLTGRITGISGVFEGCVVWKNDADRHWTWSYIAGLVSAGTIILK